MGRKKLDEERIPQILDAFERCIMKFGLAETSLERVAEEAGISRTTIHHYIGGRQELIKVAFTRFLNMVIKNIDHLVAMNVDDLADYLILGWIEEAGDHIAFIEEMDVAFSTDSEISTTATELFAYLFESVAVHLHRLNPEASLERCQDTAKMLFSLGMGSFRLSKHTKLPQNDVLRLSAKGILNALLNNTTDQ